MVFTALTVLAGLLDHWFLAVVLIRGMSSEGLCFLATAGSQIGALFSEWFHCRCASRGDDVLEEDTELWGKIATKTNMILDDTARRVLMQTSLPATCVQRGSSRFLMSLG